MIIDWSALTAAFLLGLFSSAHCVGMCGGIMGALSMAVPAHAKARRWFILLSYNLGRIASYALMGAIVGLFASQITEAGGAVWLRWLAGVLLIAMGLYLANWWRGLTYLESGGRYLWAYLQPLGKALMPVDTVPKAVALGAIWGWLPCGLVYSALAYAMAQGHAVGGGLVMLAFGLGTLPAVLATGFIAQQLGRLLQRPRIRWSFALAVMLFGLWTIWGGGYGSHQHHHDSSHSAMHEGMDHSGMDHSQMNHADMKHIMMNHAAMDHSESHDAAVQQAPAEQGSVLEQTDVHQHHSLKSSAAAHE
ncbi:sulfite exporter TauE/SafE family protein [Cellvibrio sp. OA-2007]|uniref:sulfite exporter TauE/SafE family protein n=1 Tax=Cellvibrio sp. OA-2007 TaxID=529823 RepID=UPI000A03220C|nr:sulfite exporter TauE/SafE family protein [Cellvibrio sp. OA-2007]